ncbi:MAG: PEP-CTERM sorting domain-containing protein [Schlesneria sp.]
MRRHILAYLCMSAVLAYSPKGDAGEITVYVGYADSIRANAFFPRPWLGDSNVKFLGNTAPGTIFDAGAIMIENRSGSSINVNDVFVYGFDNGATFDLWGTPGALANNSFMILTQTSTNAGQFDTSDQLRSFTYPDGTSGYNPSHPYTGDPKVQITINGNVETFSDTGHILDTGGYDAATYGINGSNFPYNPAHFPQNESLQWREIGTTGVSNPGGNPPTAVPEPSSLMLALFGTCGVGFAVRSRRIRRSEM